MNIPNLPTDNMYKFQYFFGLFLTCVSAFLLLNSFSTSSMRLSDIEKNTSKWKRQFETLKEVDKDISSIKKVLNNSKTEIDQTLISRINKVDSDNYMKHLELRENIESSSDDIKTIKEDIQRNLFFYGIFIFVGVIQWLPGSYWWYMKLQRYEDAIVEVKAKKAIKSLENSNRKKTKI